MSDKLKERIISKSILIVRFACAALDVVRYISIYCWSIDITELNGPV
jgi:hypothetical protein